MRSFRSIENRSRTRCVPCRRRHERARRPIHTCWHSPTRPPTRGCAQSRVRPLCPSMDWGRPQGGCRLLRSRSASALPPSCRAPPTARAASPGSVSRALGTRGCRRRRCGGGWTARPCGRWVRRCAEPHSTATTTCERARAQTSAAARSRPARVPRASVVVSRPQSLRRQAARPCCAEQWWFCARVRVSARGGRGVSGGLWRRACVPR
jgi:hypothetical protein